MTDETIKIQYKKASFLVTFRYGLFDDGRLNVTATAGFQGQIIKTTAAEDRESALSRIVSLVVTHLDKGSLVYKEHPQVPAGMEGIYPANPETKESLNNDSEPSECPADRPNMFREVLTLIVGRVNDWEDKQEEPRKTLIGIKELCKAYLSPFKQSRATNMKSIYDSVHVKLTKAGRKVIQGKHSDSKSDEYKKDVEKFNDLLKHVESVFGDLTTVDDSLYRDPHPLMRLLPYMMTPHDEHERERMDRCVKKCIHQLELIQESRKYTPQDPEPEEFENRWDAHDAVSRIRKIIENVITRPPEALLDEIIYLAARALLNVNYCEPAMTEKLKALVLQIEQRRGPQ